MTARIYADHAATTPMREEAVRAMMPHLSGGFNASSAHAEGRAARAALDDARERVARALGASPREIVFTTGGSEGDNLAILGAVRATRAKGRSPAHVVSQATEHRAVLHALGVLRDEGVAVTILGVDENARVDPEEFAAALRPETVLVSLMLANNEVGTVHPVAEFARLARAAGALVHCDAVQAPGRVPVDVDALGVDLLSISGHKFYGPKGTGALYVRRGTPLAPVIVGGGQEAGRRAGTENVAGAVGMATALDLAVAELPEESERLRRGRDRFESAVLAAVPGSRIAAAAVPRLPNLSSIAFAGVDSPELLARLDLDGAAVSAGSACASGATEASHVIGALGPGFAGSGTIRFSFGKLTSEQDLERLAKMVPLAVASLRDEGVNVGTGASGSFMSRSEVRS